MDKLVMFVESIVSFKESTEYSASLVAHLANRGAEFDWVKALLEQAKLGNKPEVKKLKESALDVLILISQLRENLHIIG